MYRNREKKFQMARNGRHVDDLRTVVLFSCYAKKDTVESVACYGLPVAERSFNYLGKI